MHLLPLRPPPETACGQPGESTPEINEVTCPECKQIHDEYLEAQEARHV
jgi:hypothetical protein